MILPGTRASGYHQIDTEGERCLREWAMSFPTTDFEFEDADRRVEELARRREAELEDLSYGVSPSSTRVVASTCPSVSEGREAA